MSRNGYVDVATGAGEQLQQVKARGIELNTFRAETTSANNRANNRFLLKSVPAVDSSMSAGQLEL